MGRSTGAASSFGTAISMGAGGSLAFNSKVSLGLTFRGFGAFRPVFGREVSSSGSGFFRGSGCFFWGGVSGFLTRITWICLILSGASGSSGTCRISPGIRAKRPIFKRREPARAKVHPPTDRMRPLIMVLLSLVQAGRYGDVLGARLFAG
ncbi:MAG: hypothetical protein MI892_08650, partial [Desulfobacterales bacterium]|nr:hypothetical protein [Desulfobacterales bacterium]